MPLAPEQDLVTVSTITGDANRAIVLLKEQLAVNFDNDVRIISLAMTETLNAIGVNVIRVMAVIESAD